MTEYLASANFRPNVKNLGSVDPCNLPLKNRPRNVQEFKNIAKVFYKRTFGFNRTLAECEKLPFGRSLLTNKESASTCSRPPYESFKCVVE